MLPLQRAGFEELDELHTLKRPVSAAAPAAPTAAIN
jgi:hypothetical protein